MREQFFLVGQAREVPAHHLVCSQCGLPAGPQGYQHTGNNRRIHLQFDSVLVVAEQMTAVSISFELLKPGICATLVSFLESS